MKKRAGVGAVCSAPLRYAKPTRIISAKYSTTTPKQRLENLLALRKESRQLNGHDQICIIFRHVNFDGVELCTHQRWCKVHVEGPESHIFDDQAESLQDQVLEEEQQELPEMVLHHVDSEDVVLFRNEGFDVDDDNEPTPENVSINKEALPTESQSWGWRGICHRKASTMVDHPPKLIGLSETEAKCMTYFSLFLWFFPLDFLHEVLLKKLNENLEREKERIIGLGEILRYIGIWFYMATFAGFTRQQFWSANEIDDFQGAPVRLNSWMSRRRFELITTS
jgi:Transposase IS4